MIRNFLVTLLAAFAVHAFAAVEVNQASRADLETVKGIGPALSAKIVKARDTGSFSNWADFVGRVGGIGVSNAARLSNAGLTVHGTHYDASKMPAPGKKSARPHHAKAATSGG
jgi:competence protein ComEA